MTESTTTCSALSEALIAADDPAPVLPAALPCSPIDLLVALHQHAVAAMLSDPARAQRAAAAAWCVALREPDDPLLQAQAHWTQASAILYLPDYLRSLEHYDAALACYEEACVRMAPARPSRDVRVVHVVRVFCLTELGRYYDALQVVAEAERWLQAHPHPYAQLTLLLNRSLLAGNMGEYDAMARLADMTATLATEMGDHGRTAQGWLNHAYACMFLGRYSEAATAIDRGIAAAEQAEEPLTVARAHALRVRLLRLKGALFAALGELDHAARGLAPASNEAATIALEQAALYEQLRQLPEARRAAQAAARQYAQLAMPGYSVSAALKAARIAIQQRELSLARALLALAREQAATVGLPLLGAEVTLAEAELVILAATSGLQRQGNRTVRLARAAACEAVGLLRRHGLALEVALGELTLAALDALLGAKASAARAYRALLDHTSPQLRLAACSALATLYPPAEALPYLQQAVALAVEQRRALPMEEIQARYSGETSEHHLRLATCLLELGHVPRALEATWEAKAGALLDLRATAGALDQTWARTLEEAKADLAHWREIEREHRRKAHDALLQRHVERTAYHTEHADTALARLHEHERRLAEQLRLLGGREGRGRVPALNEVQAALPEATGVLEYVRIGDELYSFLIQPDRPPRCRRLGSYHHLMSRLDRWRLVCHRLLEAERSAGAPQLIHAALAPLWEQLLAPWVAELAALTQLVIAPVAALYDLPWAGLASLGPSLDCPIALAPSGALLTRANAPEPGVLGPPRLLGYAGEGVRRLEHVQRELALVAQSLPGAEVRPAATASDLREEPPPWLLHLAAHAHTNAALPLCSTIDLADGPFLLLEAHRLNLRGTRLVTLSACETGVRPEYGEMTLALAGAFICAGAEAVLASLWPVADATTATLMGHFYRAREAGLPASQALRHAQQALRPEAPLDWMAFQLWAGVALD